MHKSWSILKHLNLTFPLAQWGVVSYVRIATLHLEIHFTSHQNPPNPLSDFWGGDLSKYYNMLQYVTIEISQQNIVTYCDIPINYDQSRRFTGSDQHLLTSSLLGPALVTCSPSAFASCLYLREMGSTGKNKKGKGKAASGGESARSEAQIHAHNNYYQKWVQIGFLYVLDSHSFDSHKEEISICNKQKCACAKWVFVCWDI